MELLAVSLITLIVGPDLGCVLPEDSLDQGSANPPPGQLQTDRKVGVDLILSQQDRVLLSQLQSELTSSRDVGQLNELNEEIGEVRLVQSLHHEVGS